MDRGGGGGRPKGCPRRSIGISQPRHRRLLVHARLGVVAYAAGESGLQLRPLGVGEQDREVRCRIHRLELALEYVVGERLAGAHPWISIGGKPTPPRGAPLREPCPRGPRLRVCWGGPLRARNFASDPLRGRRAPASENAG